MKKTLIIFLVLIALVAAPTLTIAYDDTVSQVHSKKLPQLNMTEKQKAEMISLKKQTLELKKQIIRQNEEAGTITEQQAKKMEDRINARLKALDSGDLSRYHRNHCPKAK